MPCWLAVSYMLCVHLCTHGCLLLAALHGRDGDRLV